MLNKRYTQDYEAWVTLAHEDLEGTIWQLARAFSEAIAERYGRECWVSVGPSADVEGIFVLAISLYSHPALYRIVYREIGPRDMHDIGAVIHTLAKIEGDVRHQFRV